MSLKISLTGSALFKSSAFSFPYCKKSIIASLITFLFRNTTSPQVTGNIDFSTTLSGHIGQMHWDTVALMESTLKKMLWCGKNTSAGGDFPSEVRLSSRQGVNSCHTKRVACCVSFSEHKHKPTGYDADEI